MFARLLKPTIFAVSLLPLALLGREAYTGGLSANPIDDITDATGTWALRFLMFTLTVTPLVTVTGLSRLGTLRRMLGLFAFFYAILHFMTYIWLDKFFDLDDMFADVVRRQFITAGFVTLLILLPLALTSTKSMTIRLGGRTWKRLHRLTYLAAAGGVVHYLWLVKADRTRPLTYGAILAVLLGFRLWTSIRKRRAIHAGAAR